ncbi:MAG: hypothetical protein EZS28_051290, partial [Streblomastix strix]
GPVKRVKGLNTSVGSGSYRVDSDQMFVEEIKEMRRIKADKKKQRLIEREREFEKQKEVDKQKKAEQLRLKKKKQKEMEEAQLLAEQEAQKPTFLRKVIQVKAPQSASHQSVSKLRESQSAPTVKEMKVAQNAGKKNNNSNIADVSVLKGKENNQDMNKDYNKQSKAGIVSSRNEQQQPQVGKNQQQSKQTNNNAVQPQGNKQVQKPYELPQLKRAVKQDNKSAPLPNRDNQKQNNEQQLLQQQNQNLQKGKNNQLKPLKGAIPAPAPVQNQQAPPDNNQRINKNKIAPVQSLPL